MIDYSSLMARKVQDIKPSGIRKFFGLAEQMEDVISLGVGDPDFKTPWAIRHKAIETLERGMTRYSANAGLLDGLKKQKAIAQSVNCELKKEQNILYLQMV